MKYLLLTLVLLISPVFAGTIMQQERDLELQVTDQYGEVHDILVGL